MCNNLLKLLANEFFYIALGLTDGWSNNAVLKVKSAYTGILQLLLNTWWIEFDGLLVNSPVVSISFQ